MGSAEKFAVVQRLLEGRHKVVRYIEFGCRALSGAGRSSWRREGASGRATATR